MMTTQNAIAMEVDPDVRQDDLELLLQDRNWVAAEFAAIMRTSGWGHRLIVGTMPLPTRDRVTSSPDTSQRVLARCRRRSTSPRSRVRSPPGR